jgi:hypothetical protein
MASTRVYAAGHREDRSLAELCGCHSTDRQSCLKGWEWSLRGGLAEQLEWGSCCSYAQTWCGLYQLSVSAPLSSEAECARLRWLRDLDPVALSLSDPMRLFVSIWTISERFETNFHRPHCFLCGGVLSVRHEYAVRSGKRSGCPLILTEPYSPVLLVTF